MADEQKFTWAKSKEPVPSIYANFMHVSWTLFDVRFQLGQLIPTEPGVSNAFVAEECGAVVMAWPAVKAFRDNLIGLIDSYERTNGTIESSKLVPAPPPSTAEKK